MRTRLLAGVPALLLLATLSACGDDSDDDKASDDTSASTSPSAEPTATETTSEPSSETAETSSSAAAGGTSCTFTPDGSEPARKVSPPAATTDLKGQIPAVIETSVGDLELTLDADKAPCTVASFVSLARQGYYDDTSCHRQGNDPGFEFLQCGDPYFDPDASKTDPRTGTGGPGYTVPDELNGSEAYPAGTLAMAKSTMPNSGGSQFFIVFGDSQFPPDYTVWGHLAPASLAVLKKATASGNDGYWAQAGGGRPNTPVTFKRIELQ